MNKKPSKPRTKEKEQQNKALIRDLQSHASRMVEAFRPNGPDPDPIIYEVIEFSAIALRQLPEDQRPPK